MANYVFVYYNQGSMGDAPVEEVKKAWGAWFGSLGDKLVDGGNPFNDNGMAVEASGASKIENYPATGYSIVKAGSMDDAVKIAKGCPLLADNGPEGAAVRVYETVPM
jgi:hypothetical protein